MYTHSLTNTPKHVWCARVYPFIFIYYHDISNKNNNNNYRDDDDDEHNVDDVKLAATAMRKGKK